MVKTAIFVEGQTELIFVREYLLKMFDYQNIWIDCYTLFKDSNFQTTEYSFPNNDADNYFQIINVGNDNAVITRLLNREQYLWNVGFHKIIGIRDMYSRNYREAVQNATIDEAVNLKFIEGAKSTIKQKAKNAENIHFHFAIMEAEAWILGLKECFMHLHQNLDTVYIAEQLGFNLNEVDPEKAFFHPAATIEKIYALAGTSYNKSKGDINAIMSNIQKADFVQLNESSKCDSFSNVHKALMPNF